MERAQYQMTILSLLLLLLLLFVERLAVATSRGLNLQWLRKSPFYML